MTQHEDDDPQMAAEQPLVACSAVTLELKDLDLHRGVTMFWVGGFLCLVMLTATMLSSGVLGGASMFPLSAPCCCTSMFVPLSCFGWISMTRLLAPLRRGRLRLFADELVFAFTIRSAPAVHISLRTIERLGRNGHRLHIRVRGTNNFYFFACSRLHAEDMYDQLTAQLDNLGIEITSYERQRR